MTVLVIAVLAVFGAVVIFGGNDDPKDSKSARATKIADYDNNDLSSVSWTMQGKLVGEDQRTAIRVTVSRSKRTVEVLSGYEERVDRKTEQPNTPAAFASFVRALDNARFGTERSVKQADDRGMCPMGNVYIYRLTEAGREVMRTWSDSCSTKDGPYGGTASTASLIQQLFKAQITDYSKFTSGTKLF